MRIATLLLMLCTVSVSAQAPRGTEPIRLDPHNPHYFLYRGKTIALITSGEHYGSVMNALFDYHKYLATLEAEGLNYTRLFGGSYVEVPGTSFGIKRNTLAPAAGRLILPWARSEEPGYAGGGNKFDLDKWDAEYFRRLNDFLSEAERRGVVVEISLFSSQYGEPQWRVSPFNAANNVNQTGVADYKKVNTLDNGNVLEFQERYVRKLVDEANAHPNAIFEIQNEPWSDHPVLTDVVNPYLFPPARDQYPNSVEVADADSVAWQARVAEWIASEEAKLPHRHLIAQCYSNFRLPVRTLVAGVDMVNFHYAYPEAATLNLGLSKAIAYDETGFLGRGDDAYRRQAWNFMLAGGGAFDALDYSFSVGHEDGTDTEPNGPGGGSVEFRRQLGILAKFLASFPLTGMAPDQTVLVQASGVIARAMANGNKSRYAIYFDGNGPSRITLHLPAGNYSVDWLDPKTGANTSADTIMTRGGDVSIRSPEFTNGIALSLTRVYPQT